MNKTKITAIALLFAITTTVTAPVYAFSLTDLLPQPAAPTTSSGGNGALDLLLGLLLGKMFSNISSSATASSPASALSQVLGLSSAPSSEPSAGISSATAKGQALIDTGKKFMGVPYVWGGETPSGFDCSGFTQYVMKQNGITIPRTAAEQFAAGTPVDKSNLKVGDLVFFTTYKPGASHVGFYMGNDQFLHASSANNKVTISSLSETYYTEKYIGARRYM